MSTQAAVLDFKQLTNEIYEHGITGLPHISPVQWANELSTDKA